MRIVKTKTSDGFQFSGLFSEAKNSKKIIIHIHGMAGTPLINNYYQEMHDEYSKNGYSFLVGEHRGSGTATEFVTDDGVKVVGNAFEKFEDCVFDIQAWVKFAIKKGYREIWIQSHSLGPSKVAYYMNTEKPKNIKGLIWLSPSDMIGLVHDPEGEKDHKRLLPEAKKLVKQNKGKNILSHGLWGSVLLSANTYLNFFGKKTKTAIFNYGIPKLGWEVVNNISVPVLAITGTKDDGIVPVMDANKAMKILKKELINSPKVKTIVYKDCEHSFDGFGKKITSDVLGFISNV